MDTDAGSAGFSPLRVAMVERVQHFATRESLGVEAT